MVQYIDKDALVAWAKETYLCENASMIRKVCYKQLLEHLNTLEVKDVDLEREIDGELKTRWMKPSPNSLKELKPALSSMSSRPPLRRRKASLKVSRLLRPSRTTSTKR